MVRKLWGYFIPAPPGTSTLKALERAYVQSGFEVRPLLEAILRHPLFYDGPRMVTPEHERPLAEQGVGLCRVVRPGGDVAHRVMPALDRVPKTHGYAHAVA